ncbi:MAG: DUF4870 domain-containing protein [Flavobacteriaceae bacterium]
MVTQQEKNTTFLTHLSGFGGFIFPFGSIIIPLVIREVKKDDSILMDATTKDVVNFNLSYLLYTYILKISFIPFVFTSFLGNFNSFSSCDNMTFHFNMSHPHFNNILSIASIIGILSIVKAVLIIKACIKTNDNESYKYPFTIKFIS